MRELAAAGLAIGESGAAPLAGLRTLAARGELAGASVLLIATEGPTGAGSHSRRNTHVPNAPAGFPRKHS